MIEDVFYYNHNKYGPNIILQRYQINYHELTLLLDGKMIYYVNDEKYEMKSGDIIYLTPGSIRQRDICDGNNNYVGLNFHSTEKLSLKTLTQNGINDDILTLIEYLDSIYMSNSSTKAKKFTNILETLVLQITDNVLNSGKPNLANEIANYLIHHYRQKITLEDISRETFFSVAYCESEFHKAFGVSIIQYLIDIRLSEAVKLLTGTSIPCSVIAHMVGFSDANYFSRIFKKRIGFSPLKYRATAPKLEKAPI